MCKDPRVSEDVLVDRLIEDMLVARP